MHSHTYTALARWADNRAEMIYGMNYVPGAYPGCDAATLLLSNNDGTSGRLVNVSWPSAMSWTGNEQDITVDADFGPQSLASAYADFGDICITNANAFEDHQ